MIARRYIYTALRFPAAFLRMISPICWSRCWKHSDAAPAYPVTRHVRNGAAERSDE